MNFFDFLIIKIVLAYAVLDRSEAHSSRPRTYLPSRSGATHALRVLSSKLFKISHSKILFPLKIYDLHERTVVFRLASHDVTDVGWLTELKHAFP